MKQNESMQTDNWQEALVEKLARAVCAECMVGCPTTEDEEAHLDTQGKIVTCFANRIGLREAIRRTLEKAAEMADDQAAPMPNAGHFALRAFAAALRQLMEPGK